MRMIKRIIRALSIACILVLAVSVPALAQLPGYNNYCQIGGQPVVLQGLSSTTLVQSSYPKCTVTVYNTGTTTLSVISATPGGGGLANPFQANIDGSFLFFASGSSCYDIVLSPSTSGGTPVMPVNFTYTGVCPGGGGGGGGGGSSFISSVGFQAVPASLPNLVFAQDPSGTCSYNPGILTAGQIQVCNPGNGSNALWLNPGTGNAQLFSTRLPTSSAFTNGAVPQWVAANSDYEILPLAVGGGLSGMTSGQVPVAATATTVTSSKPIQGTDASLLSSGTIGGGAGAALCIDANSGATTSGCSSAPTSFGTITAGTNTALLVEGTGGSLTPSGIGQSAATQNWLTVGPLTPVFSSAANAGGSLNQNHGYSFKYTYTSAAGESLPGGELQLNSPGGACASINCTITLTGPTLPSGFTSYTTYMTDCGSGTCSGGELKLGACTNLASGVSCTATTTGAGALPASNAAYKVPNPIGTNTCSPAGNPFWFVFDGTSFFPYAAVDDTNTGVNPPSPYNKVEFCRPIWFLDSGSDPPAGRNALVLINHMQNGVITNINNQDRGLQIETFNCLPLGSCADAATHYALEGIQVEQSIMGTPTINGSPDGEVTAGSFQLSFYPTSGITSTNFGSNAIRATFFRQASASVDSNGMNGINVAFANGSTVSGGGAAAAGVRSSCTNSVAASNISCSAYIGIVPNTASQFTNQNIFYIPSVAAYTPRAGTDWLIRNDIQTMAAQMNGLVYMNGIVSNTTTTLPVTASLAVTPSVTMSQAVMTAPSSVTCAGGASTYTYAFVGNDGNGGQAISTGVNTAGTCTNPLTVGNPATVNFATGLSAANAATIGSFKTISVYRTGGPMATGLVGTMSCIYVGPVTSCNAFVDTGLAASGTIPTVNTTGGITTPINGVSHLAGNSAYLDANFTTANNTNLQIITGSSHNLVFNLPANAQVYNFHCALSYSQATANVAVAFGIQSATVAPNNIFANGTEQITVGPPATVVTGTLATLASTTATSIVSGTPGALATNYTVYLDGTVDNPANNQGNVLNFMVSTAAGADAVTVLKGSYCRLY
jgi:hypothetical protein